jgi:hypothetical protein
MRLTLLYINKLFRFTGFSLLLMTALFTNYSCEKDPLVPENQNDTIDYGEAVVIPFKPHGIAESKDYTVWVNDTMVFTGQAGNNYHGYYSFCTFDFEGIVTIRVRANQSVNHLDILPRILGINYQNINSETIEFTLDEPEMITLLVNGSNDRALHFLMSLPEVDPPEPMDENVIYYSAGHTHDIGILKLKDNQTLYIEGGARLNGMVLVKDARNVKILGRGMIDGTLNQSSGNSPEGDQPWRLLYMSHAENITLEGITFYNSLRWTIHPYSCKNLTIENIRVLNWNYGSDGIDLSACQEVEIKNSFLRTNDDAIAIKALSFAENAFIPNPRIDNMDVMNVLVEGCTIWNMAYGNALEIGYELRCDLVSDIIFRDCDVIRQQGRGAVLSIHNGDNAVVENILYDNIRVENAETGGTGKKLMDLAIFYSLFSYDSYWGDILPNNHWDNLLSPWGVYGSASNRGLIQNIYFRDIQVLDDNFPYSVIRGWDMDHIVENVTFDNITVRGNKITDEAELDLLFYNEHYKNIQIK